MDDNSKLLVTMTAEELRAVISEVSKEIGTTIVDAIQRATQVTTETQEARQDVPEYVFGYEGLASLWGITAKTARKRVDSGVLNGAVKKECGVLVTNAPLALKKWSEHIKKTKARR